MTAHSRKQELVKYRDQESGRILITTPSEMPPNQDTKNTYVSMGYIAHRDTMSFPTSSDDPMISHPHVGH